MKLRHWQQYMAAVLILGAVSMQLWVVLLDIDATPMRQIVEHPAELVTSLAMFLLAVLMIDGGK